MGIENYRHCETQLSCGNNNKRFVYAFFATFAVHLLILWTEAYETGSQWRAYVYGTSINHLDGEQL